MKKKRKKKTEDGVNSLEANEADDRQTIKRMDVSLGKQDRRNLYSSVIKCSLSERFCHDTRYWMYEARAVMLQVLDEQVQSLS